MILLPGTAGTDRSDRTELGLRIVSVDLSYPPWREAFVMPDAIHGVVVQIADSTLSFPPISELMATRERDMSKLPGNRGGAEPDWWDFTWEEAPERVARLLSTTLRTTDAEVSEALFATILGGTSRRIDNGTEYSWDRGKLEVVVSDQPGIDHLTLSGGPDGDFWIGSTQFREGGAST